MGQSGDAGRDDTVGRMGQIGGELDARPKAKESPCMKNVSGSAVLGKAGGYSQTFTGPQLLVRGLGCVIRPDIGAVAHITLPFGPEGGNKEALVMEADKGPAQGGRDLALGHTTVGPQNTIREHPVSLNMAVLAHHAVVHHPHRIHVTPPLQNLSRV